MWIHSPLLSQLIHRHNLRIVLITALALSLWTSTIAVAQAQTAPAQTFIYDKIVAVAAGNPILLSEVRSKVRQGPLVVVSEFPSAPTDTPFDRALHDAINLALITEACINAEIEVTDEDIDRQLRSITEQQQASLDDLKQYLRSQNIAFEKYRQDLAQQILVQKFYARILRPVSDFSDQRLKERYQMRFGSSPENIRYSLEGVLIPVGPDHHASLQTAKTLSANIRSQKTSSNFVFSTWAQNHQATHPHRYISLGKLHQSELMAAFREALQKLPAGAITAPIPTPTGIYILHVQDKTVTEKPHYQSQKQNLTWELQTESRSQALQEWLLVERSRQKQSLLP